MEREVKDADTVEKISIGSGAAEMETGPEIEVLTSAMKK